MGKCLFESFPYPRKCLMESFPYPGKCLLESFPYPGECLLESFLYLGKCLLESFSYLGKCFMEEFFFQVSLILLASSFLLSVPTQRGGRRDGCRSFCQATADHFKTFVYVQNVRKKFEYFYESKYENEEAGNKEKIKKKTEYSVSKIES
jgi:hypothetical protein